LISLASNFIDKFGNLEMLQIVYL